MPWLRIVASPSMNLLRSAALRLRPAARTPSCASAPSTMACGIQAEKTRPIEEFTKDMTEPRRISEYRL
ncbi:hypothetical protein D3C80_1579300 [compost metagenome]